MNTVTFPPFNQVLRLEGLWILVTVLLVALIMAPIALNLQGYPFWITNIIFIVTFITVARHIFLLQFSFLARKEWVKLVVIFVFIPVVFLLVQELTGFQTFLDEEGMEAIVGNMPLAQQEMMMTYVRSEMVFFGVGSIISCVILPFRLALSIWLLRNRGRV